MSLRLRGGREQLIETAPDQTTTDSRWRSLRAGWATAAAVFIAFAIVALANMRTGLRGDPRTKNLNPGVAPHPPFLGVTNWPLVTSIMSAVLTVAPWSLVTVPVPSWNVAHVEVIVHA
jgi:hypothetical protein